MVGVKNASTGTISRYVNVTLAGSTAFTAAWSSTGALLIGRDLQSAAANQYTNGQISNVQAYPAALSAAQISTLYTNGMGGGTLSSSSGVTTSSTYDPRGLQTSTTDGDGNTTSYVYDQAGQLAETIDPPVSVESDMGSAVQERPISQTQYDTFGDPVATMDPDLNETQYAYDADGQKVSETGAGYTPTVGTGAGTSITPVTHWTYDAEGNLTQETEPDGEATKYLYDQLGDVVQQTDPDGGTTDSTFDTNGDQLASTDPNGA